MRGFMKRIIIIFLLLVVGSYTYARSGDDINWQKLSENNYINPDGIIGTDDIYGYSFIIKSYNKGQYERVNGNDVWYTLSQYTIDCSKMKYKIGMIDSYGYEDNFVNGDYNRYAKFQPIASGTAVSEAAKKLCRP